MKAWIFASTIIAAAFLGCTSCPDPALNASQNIMISWELLENLPGKEETCRARFAFFNSGTEPVTGEGWKLYFNQATILPAELPDSSKGLVSHINGDLYLFKPGPSFRIDPGDSLAFEYSYHGFMIKESDAPCGLYFAGNDNTEDNRNAYLPKNFYVKPFADYSRVFPGMPSLFPLPEYDYIRNSALTDIPPEKLCPIIPTPRRFTRGSGFVELSDSTVVYYEKGLETEADYIITVAADFFGGLIRKEEGTKNSENSISLRFSEISVDNIAKEAYHLTARLNEGIIIEGSDRPGVFYGIQSLLSLVPFDEISPQVLVVHIPCVEIWDAPRFGYRGFLLDLARNFQDKKT
ncbi:MAG: carbohydate-binding domain-containing protein, partial [Bacteroidales bacterium]|nr:carbohydate-binding domain-containing protein [Bacteroidales bacterium]